MAVTQEEVWKQQNKVKELHTLAMIAINSSAIAYALAKTEGKVLGWSLIPLGLAIICWCVSFFLCIRYLRVMDDFFYSQGALFDIQKGTHEDSSPDPRHRKVEMEVMSKILNKKNDQIRFVYVWKNSLMIAGVISFALWNLWEMLERSGVHLIKK